MLLRLIIYDIRKEKWKENNKNQRKKWLIHGKARKTADRHGIETDCGGDITGKETDQMTGTQRPIQKLLRDQATKFLVYSFEYINKGRCFKLYTPDSDIENNDVSTVQSQHNDLVPEEFPEGPYGSSMEVESIGKSSPWREGQHSPRPFGYENKELHEEEGRLFPGEDPVPENSQEEE